MKKFLSEIAEKAKLKNKYEEEIIKFSDLLLKDWVIKSSEKANEGLNELILCSFELSEKFEDVHIKYLINDGLIEYLSKITGLDVVYKEFIIDRSEKKIYEIQNNKFEKIISKNYASIGYISINW